jgi:hypothetical protein
MSTFPHVFSDSQSRIARINNRFSCEYAVAHIATKYDFAADMCKDGEINSSYVQTVEMFADCVTKPQPKPAFLIQCAAMGMIRIGLGNGLRTVRSGHGMGIGNGLGYSLLNGLINNLGNLLEYFPDIVSVLELGMASAM